MDKPRLVRILKFKGNERQRVDFLVELDPAVLVREITQSVAEHQPYGRAHNADQHALRQAG